MQKLKKKKHIKGSTLLLAMVVISTVLFAGIGVATILSRQIKEIPLVENETRGFYIAETIADMMNKNDLEEADCEGINVGDQDIECSAEKVNDKYHVIVKVGNNYYSFIKNIGDADMNDGDNEYIEGYLTIYYQTDPWDKWEYLAYRSYSSDADKGASNIVKLNDSLNYYKWKFYKEIDFEGRNGIQFRFSKSESGPWGNMYFVNNDKKIINLRQEKTKVPIPKIDGRIPVTIYYNTKGDSGWSTPHVAYRLEDSGTPIASRATTTLDPIKMHDVSGEYGDYWYMLHLSIEGESAIEVFFTNNTATSGLNDYGSYKGSFYRITKEMNIVNIIKDSKIVNQGYPSN